MSRTVSNKLFLKRLEEVLSYQRKYKEFALVINLYQNHTEETFSFIQEFTKTDSNNIDEIDAEKLKNRLYNYFCEMIKYFKKLEGVIAESEINLQYENEYETFGFDTTAIKKYLLSIDFDLDRLNYLVFLNFEYQNHLQRRSFELGKYIHLHNNIVKKYADVLNITARLLSEIIPESGTMIFNQPLSTGDFLANEYEKIKSRLKSNKKYQLIHNSHKNDKEDKSKIEWEAKKGDIVVLAQALMSCRAVKVNSRKVLVEILAAAFNTEVCNPDNSFAKMKGKMIEFNRDHNTYSEFLSNLSDDFDKFMKNTTK